MMSRKHKNALKAQTKHEIKEAGSFKKFLIHKGFITSIKHNLNKMRYLLYINSINKMFK
jgi:hypothetical protein